MAISDLPILSMLRTKMNWHQARQQVLSENVANADTPNFRPRDLATPDFERPPLRSVSLLATNPMHLTGLAGGSSSQFGTARESAFETRPAGNAVSLEDEMMKVAANQMDYQAATTLYSRSLGLLKTAVGKR
ncbi:MAG: flagellar basal body rod protein FlgB [Pseudorhodoplanes sp.]|nr:flagellar basal body rod protein FlgB [Pseudorhodoplanes sp.]MCQ3942400.1 flagellar basal body rod protein FlgB [Alphaproteobacteria bacterium]